MNIKITPEEIHKLVATHLRLSGPFTLEIVDPNPIPKLPPVEEQPAASTGLCSGVAELPPLRILPALNSYDWAEVFGEGTGGNCTPIIPSGPPGSEVNLDTFSRADVSLILGQEEGENDGADWIVWGQLEDLRFFIARGGCDYTGWECRADNSGNVAKTREELIAYGMSEDERKRFKLELPGDDKSVPVTSRGGLPLLPPW